MLLLCTISNLVKGSLLPNPQILDHPSDYGHVTFRQKKQLIAMFEIYDAHYFNDIPKSIYQPLLFDKSFHYSV